MAAKPLEPPFVYINLDNEFKTPIAAGARSPNNHTVWFEPELVRPYSHRNRNENQSLHSRIRRLMATLSIDTYEWLFDLTIHNIRTVTGEKNDHDILPVSPDITFEHYYYEHSSDWILPHYEHGKDES